MGGRIFTSGEIIRGDIITVVMDITESNFKDALRLMHDILGLPFVMRLSPRRKYDPLKIFKKARSGVNNSDYELTPQCESVLDSNDYIHLPHIDLVREGIIPSVQEEFGVIYDMRRKRILFPHRHWSSGELLGIFGRTTNPLWNILGIPKYFGVIPYPKSLNLYGLYENYKEIQKAGFVICVEGEKSVQKAKSLGYPNLVALGGHELSDEQVKILIGLNVDITFALDNDLDEQISKDMCKRFKGIRSAYYLYDNHGLLGEKDSPIDCGRKRFNYLLKYRKKGA